MNDSYKDICKSLKAGGWYADFETATIKVDKNLSTLLDLPVQKLSFNSFYDLIAPDEKEAIVLALESYPSTQLFNCLINLKIEGKYYLVEAVLDNSQFSEGKIVRGMGYMRLNSIHTSASENVHQFSLEELIPNISQRKNLETFYQEQNRRIGLACKVGLIYPWTWYVMDNSLEFLIFDDTKITKQVSSLSEFASSINPNDKTLFYLEIGKVALGKSQNLHLKYRSSNFNDDTSSWYEMIGEAFEFDDYGKCTKVVGVVYDITDREQKLKIQAENERLLIAAKNKAEEAVAEQVKQREEITRLNTLMDAILNNIPIYLFVKDPNNEYRYLYWNKAMAENTKMPAEKVLGFKDEELFLREEDIRRFKNDDYTLMSTRKNMHTIEEYLTAEGEKRITSTVRALIPSNKELPLILGISWDITELKKTEEELIIAKNKAEENNRLKSAFLANMSHEIRTPLNAIVGFSDLLVETTTKEEKTEYMEFIQKNNDLLLQLISDILDLSKIEAQTMEFVLETTDVNKLCNSVVAAGNLRREAKVPVIFENSIPECYIHTDKNRINQVLSNLVSNSLKFTSTGDVRVGYNIVNDKTIQFYVKDTGIGIKAEKLESVFERFVKLNHFAQGTGLGLSICKNIVEQLNGQIGVESEWGKGSYFWFTLPYDKELKSDEELEKKIPDFLKTTKSKKIKKMFNRRINILIAEDIDSNYQLIKDAFKEKYNLIRAINGLEAIEKYKEFLPDLILMDIKMPEMDGLEATKQIRKIDPLIPIIAVTAYAYESDIQQANAAGCNSFLTKPLSINTLEKKISEYIG